MLKQVDKSDTHIIQKVTLPDGTVLRYQTVELDKKTNKPICREAYVKAFGTLRQARVYAGLLEPIQTPQKGKKKGFGGKSLAQVLADDREAKRNGYNATEEFDAFQM